MESQLRFGDLGVIVKGRKNNGFFDNSHLQYYNWVQCGEKMKNKKEMKVEAVSVKKKLKLLKVLSNNLSIYSDMSIGDKLVDDGGNMFSQLSHVLLDQLQQAKAEKKEIERKMKEEKKKKKKKLNSMMSDSDSSSTSSESSDDECKEVINMKNQTNLTANKERVFDELQQLQFQTDTSICSSSLSGSNKSSCSSVVVETSGERIDVCMGGKCKKFGAEALLEELQRKVGVEGAVVGCKCMGKCKNAPNVRVVNNPDAPTNPLYLGVGLENIDVIVSGLLDHGRKNIGSMTVA